MTATVTTETDAQRRHRRPAHPPLSMRTIAYWAATGIVAFVSAATGAALLSRAPQFVTVMQHLGYPPYFSAILGTWKELAALTIILPGLPRLKEWAYAGMFFDASSAAISHAASGDGLSQVIVPLVIAGILGFSWWLRPSGRRLRGRANLWSGGGSNP